MHPNVFLEPQECVGSQGSCPGTFRDHRGRPRTSLGTVSDPVRSNSNFCASHQEERNSSFSAPCLVQVSYCALARLPYSPVRAPLRVRGLSTVPRCWPGTQELKSTVRLRTVAGAKFGGDPAWRSRCASWHFGEGGVSVGWGCSCGSDPTGSCCCSLHWLTEWRWLRPTWRAGAGAAAPS